MLRRQIFSILAAWGLFFQLLIMGLHVPSSIALAGLADTPASKQSTYLSILICTKTGLQKIALDKNNQPVEGNIPADQRGASCPICQSPGAQALLVDPIGLPFPRQTQANSCRFPNTAIRDRFRPCTSLARAPPRL
ncbi:MAG: hypothetical protein GY927_11115 [bacterium]|nr:hypothetical protein [bacterium]